MALRTFLELLTVGSYLVTGAGSSDFIKLGTNSASAGHIRLPNNQAIYWRNAANGGDVQGISVDNFDELVLGVSGVSVVMSNALHYFMNDVHFGVDVVTPTIVQDTKVTDTAPQNLTITPQAPFASATGANRTPGSLIVNIASPTNGSTVEGALQINRSSSFLAKIGAYVGATYAGIWLGPGITPSDVNFAFIGNGDTETYLNCPNSAGAIYLALAGTTANGIYISQTAVNLTSPPNLQWSSTVASPKLFQDLDSTNSITGDTLTIQAQNATGTTTTGGKLVLQSGTGTSSDGYVEIKTGSNTAIPITPRTATTYTSAASGDSLVLNSDKSGVEYRNIIPTGISSTTSGQIGQAPAITGLSGRSLRYCVPNASSGGIVSVGPTFTQTSSGTVTGGLASGDLRQASLRNQLPVNGANVQFGVLYGDIGVLRGAVSKVGGFFVSWRIAWPQMLSDTRILIGFSPASIGANNPSNVSNTMGFACDTGDTNLTILTVNNSGTSTKTAIGAGFSKTSLATGDPNTNFTRVIEWKMWAAPNDTKVTFAVWDWSNNVEVLAPTDITATLPDSATFLRAQCFASSGATGGQNTLALMHTYAYY